MHGAAAAARRAARMSAKARHPGEPATTTYVVGTGAIISRDLIGVIGNGRNGVISAWIDGIAPATLKALVVYLLVRRARSWGGLSPRDS